MGHYFSERNCYMSLISKFRGDRDLGLCTTSVLAFGELQRDGKIRVCFDVGRIGFCHCTEVVKTKWNAIDLGLLTRQTCGQRSSSAQDHGATGHYFSERICYMFQISKCRGDRDLGQCTAMSCRSACAFRSAARALAAGLPRQDHVYKTTHESFCLHNKKIDEIRCKLDSTENPRLFEKYPTPP